jgi:isopentenyldiphosphate isomerase
MEAMEFSNRHLEKLNTHREHLNHGDNTTQENLDKLCREFEKYREILRPNEKDESFTLVDREGKFRQLSAPRWLCHLLNLRHRSVHVLLRWWSPSLGNVFVFQVRSWTKSDSPGHLDISVGGHVVGVDIFSSIGSAYREMEEELGITKADLKAGELTFLEGYESTDTRE